MATTDYLPAADTDKGTWMDNAVVKLPLYQSVLNLSEEDIQQVVKDRDMFEYTLDILNTIKQSKQHVTAFKNLLKKQTGGKQTLAVGEPPLCLHAWRIKFVHPLSGQPMEFIAPPPAWAK